MKNRKAQGIAMGPLVTGVVLVIVLVVGASYMAGGVETAGGETKAIAEEAVGEEVVTEFEERITVSAVKTGRVVRGWCCNEDAEGWEDMARASPTATHHVLGENEKEKRCTWDEPDLKTCKELCTENGFLKSEEVSTADATDICNKEHYCACTGKILGYVEGEEILDERIESWCCEEFNELGTWIPFDLRDREVTRHHAVEEGEKQTDCGSNEEDCNENCKMKGFDEGIEILVPQIVSNFKCCLGKGNYWWWGEEEKPCENNGDCTDPGSACFPADEDGRINDDGERFCLIQVQEVLWIEENDFEELAHADCVGDAEKSVEACSEESYQPLQDERVLEIIDCEQLCADKEKTGAEKELTGILEGGTCKCIDEDPVFEDMIGDGEEGICTEDKMCLCNGEPENWCCYQNTDGSKEWLSEESVYDWVVTNTHHGITEGYPEEVVDTDCGDGPEDMDCSEWCVEKGYDYGVEVGAMTSYGTETTRCGDGYYNYKWHAYPEIWEKGWEKQCECKYSFEGDEDWLCCLADKETGIEKWVDFRDKDAYSKGRYSGKKGGYDYLVGYDYDAWNDPFFDPLLSETDGVYKKEAEYQAPYNYKHHSVQFDQRTCYTEGDGSGTTCDAECKETFGDVYSGVEYGRDGTSGSCDEDKHCECVKEEGIEAYFYCCADEGSYTWSDSWCEDQKSESDCSAEGTCKKKCGDAGHPDGEFDSEDSLCECFEEARSVPAEAGAWNDIGCGKFCLSEYPGTGTPAEYVEGSAWVSSQEEGIEENKAAYFANDPASCGGCDSEDCYGDLGKKEGLGTEYGVQRYCCVNLEDEEPEEGDEWWCCDYRDNAVEKGWVSYNKDKTQYHHDGKEAKMAVQVGDMDFAEVGGGCGVIGVCAISGGAATCEEIAGDLYEQCIDEDKRGDSCTKEEQAGLCCSIKVGGVGPAEAPALPPGEDEEGEKGVIGNAVARVVDGFGNIIEGVKNVVLGAEEGVAVEGEEVVSPIGAGEARVEGEIVSPGEAVIEIEGAAAEGEIVSPGEAVIEIEGAEEVRVVEEIVSPGEAVEEPGVLEKIWDWVVGGEEEKEEPGGPTGQLVAVPMDDVGDIVEVGAEFEGGADEQNKCTADIQEHTCQDLCQGKNFDYGTEVGSEEGSCNGGRHCKCWNEAEEEEEEGEDEECGVIGVCAISGGAATCEEIVGGLYEQCLDEDKRGESCTKEEQAGLCCSIKVGGVGPAEAPALPPGGEEEEGELPGGVQGAQAIPSGEGAAQLEEGEKEQGILGKMVDAVKDWIFGDEAVEEIVSPGEAVIEIEGAEEARVVEEIISPGEAVIEIEGAEEARVVEEIVSPGDAVIEIEGAAEEVVVEEPVSPGEEEKEEVLPQAGAEEEVEEKFYKCEKEGIIFVSYKWVETDEIGDKELEKCENDEEAGYCSLLCLGQGYIGEKLEEEKLCRCYKQGS